MIFIMRLIIGVRRVLKRGVFGKSLYRNPIERLQEKPYPEYPRVPHTTVNTSPGLHQGSLS